MISTCTKNDIQILTAIDCKVVPATDNEDATHEILISDRFAAYIYCRDDLYYLLDWKCWEKYESPESAAVGCVEICHPSLYTKAYQN